MFLRGLNRNIKMNECNTEASAFYVIESLKEQLTTCQMFFRCRPWSTTYMIIIEGTITVGRTL